MVSAIGRGCRVARYKKEWEQTSQCRICDLIFRFQMQDKPGAGMTAMQTINWSSQAGRGRHKQLHQDVREIGNRL